MAYLINDDCAKCGSCELECPNEAISEGDDIYIIDSAKCSECVGAFETSRCAEICPVEAPVPDPAHAESRDELLAKYQKLHPGG